MLDVLIRLAIAAAAGATMCMLMVIGVPWPFAMLGLIIVSAVVSWRLIASRIFVVLAASAGYFVVRQLTLGPQAAVLVTENPPIADIARNAMAVCLPFALPALGSLIALLMEKRIDKRAKDHEPITEESLLAERIPVVKPEDVDYDLRDMGV